MYIRRKNNREENVFTLIERRLNLEYFRFDYNIFIRDLNYRLKKRTKAAAAKNNILKKGQISRQK